MNTKTVIIGITVGLLSAGVLAAGTEAAQAATENSTSAVTETLHTIVNFLPFPWNVVGGAVLTAGAALFAWRKTKTAKDAKGTKE